MMTFIRDIKALQRAIKWVERLQKVKKVMDIYFSDKLLVITRQYSFKERLDYYFCVRNVDVGYTEQKVGYNVYFEITIHYQEQFGRYENATRSIPFDLVRSKLEKMVEKYFGVENDVFIKFDKGNLNPNLTRIKI